MNIRCCLIDDQPAVMELIEKYILKMPGFEIVAKEHDPLEALRKFESEEIIADLTFMDIDMPKMNGIMLGSKIKHLTTIVYLTAHRNYAPESYENDAIDYIVKPIPFTKFQRCMDKVKAKFEQRESLLVTEPFIFIPGDGREKVRVTKADITHIQGASNYIWVFTIENDYLTYLSMAEMASYLPSKNFVRIHRSYIVNIAQIIKIDANTVYMPRGREIPIAESFKKELTARIRLR